MFNYILCFQPLKITRKSRWQQHNVAPALRNELAFANLPNVYYAGNKGHKQPPFMWFSEHHCCMYIGFLTWKFIANQRFIYMLQW